VAAFAQDATKLGQNYSQVLLQGYQTLEGHFEISAKLCYPDSGLTTSVLQLLTHGVTWDKTYVGFGNKNDTVSTLINDTCRYWDLPYNNYNYSYVETGVRNGYATLAIDRLGIGNSSHGDPFNTIQAQAEVEALHEITQKLRRGAIQGISHRFSKIVHVGHSFGSIQSFWLSSLYPNSTDGLVLTGWSGNASFLGASFAAFGLHSARLNQPLRFGNSSNEKIRKTLAPYASGEALVRGVQKYLQSQSIHLSTQEIWNDIATTEIGNLITGYNTTAAPLDYPPGYLTTSSLTSTHYVFLLRGFYDVELARITEVIKQPVTVGELLTEGSAPATSSFSGPVFVFTGEQDQPVCGGDCFATGTSAPNIPAEASHMFPDSETFDVYIHPNTAHGITTHYNATAGYEVIQDWLKAHGLGA
jgi:pimeloyl-ACP methyl ester carboxylesterase